METTYLIQRGTERDLHIVLGLIENAAVWLRSKDTDQWQLPWPSRMARDQRVADGLRAGRTWIVWDGPIPAATITIHRDGSPHLWTDTERRDRAAYIHRLVVDRGYKGLRLGEQLMDWAATRAVLDWRAQVLRIDVWTDNVALQNYYKDNGFELLRIHPDLDYPAGALLQRAIHREFDREFGRSLPFTELPERQLAPDRRRRERRISVRRQQLRGLVRLLDLPGSHVTAMLFNIGLLLVQFTYRYTGRYASTAPQSISPAAWDRRNTDRIRTGVHHR